MQALPPYNSCVPGQEVVMPVTQGSECLFYKVLVRIALDQLSHEVLDGDSIQLLFGGAETRANI